MNLKKIKLILVLDNLNYNKSNSLIHYKDKYKIEIFFEADDCAFMIKTSYQKILNSKKLLYIPEGSLWIIICTLQRVMLLRT